MLIGLLACGAMAQDIDPERNAAPPTGTRKLHAPLAISDETVGVLRQHQIGSIILPQGKPPFPAVVMLHGCNGVSPNTRV